jgi:hypothetical protein
MLFGNSVRRIRFASCKHEDSDTMVQNLRGRKAEGMRSRFVFDMLLPVADMH